jgi:3-dehydroquinate synthase
LSQTLGLIGDTQVNALVDLIEKAHLPIRGAILNVADNASRYIELMRSDKKAQAGDIRFVVIHDGYTASLRGAPDGMVRQVIDQCCAIS